MSSLSIANTRAELENLTAYYENLTEQLTTNPERGVRAEGYGFAKDDLPLIDATIKKIVLTIAGVKTKSARDAFAGQKIGDRDEQIIEALETLKNEYEQLRVTVSGVHGQLQTTCDKCHNFVTSKKAIALGSFLCSGAISWVASRALYLGAWALQGPANKILETAQQNISFVPEFLKP